MVLDSETSQLWWAGKELQHTKKLEDYIGKNEKTKIVAKLQKARAKNKSLTYAKFNMASSN